MVNGLLDAVDPIACPLLGLATDRRSHFSFPHAGHRCFAEKRPVKLGLGPQLERCLTKGFLTCDRFRACLDRASEHPAEAGSHPGRT